MSFKGSYIFFTVVSNDSLCLNKLRKNLAANLGRSSLTHSHGYGSADDHPTLFARFSLSFVPFIQYAG
jgi:hypothetical protein